MKKLLKYCCVAAMCLMALPASAADNDSLLFVCNDGSVYSIPAENLSISISDGQLTADNGSEHLELAAAKVSRFLFGATTAVSDITTDANSEVTIYTIDGIKLGTYPSLLEGVNQTAPGIYIISSQNQISKLQIQ